MIAPRALGAVLMVGLCVAGAAGADEPVGPRLPEHLRGLLQQEMIAIAGASHEILDALVTGHDEVVAERAQAIHDSFIMQQTLTEADRQTLKSTLPPEFMSLDRQLHATAAALAEAARRDDRLESHARFAEMIEACRSCHARFATNRFPDFTAD
jgi:hypothetical protein